MRRCFRNPAKWILYCELRRRDFSYDSFFVGTRDATINAARIARRVMEGGHEVPIGKIISRYGKSIANCAQLASVADRLYVYDNSVHNISPQLCFRASEGALNTRYLSALDWARPIFERVDAA